MPTLNEKTVKVSVSGASGQIGYAILFRILNGDVFGKDIKIDLQLIDINLDKIQKALHGVALELEDCAFPLSFEYLPICLQQIFSFHTRSSRFCSY